MKKTTILEVVKGRLKIGDIVTVCGWVRTRRDSKGGFSFLTINDGSCFHSLQVIITNQLSNYKNEVLSLTTGCSVKIIGFVKQSIGKKQNYELMATRVILIGLVENPHKYPLSAKRHSFEYLREIAHLRPRSNFIGAIARIRNTLTHAIHDFFYNEGYIWLSTPIITTSNTEGVGEMFRVSTLDFHNIPKTNKYEVDFSKDFFGSEAFLTVSGQLNAEAYACALSKIYTFGPIFRAENSNTSRHLAEFWMIEPEVAFADLNDILFLAEKMLKYVFRKVLKESNDDLMFFVERIDKDVINRLENIIISDFQKIDYTDAIKVLQKCNKKFKNPVFWGIDFSSEHERYLAEEYFKMPVIVKNYPKDIKAFYMRINDDNKTVASMDVLVPGVGEIIGGSQREERLDKLDLRMQETGLKQEDYYWYRDLRRYGTVPHSGFGLGLERLIAYVTGVSNIRDTIAFPRIPRNASF
ncbi:MAG: asparagine--tRNA ligase [Arsenophonus sp.]|nr:MAG: asparagine--tRNA ligase [Arsenophonus sp.]